MSAMHPTPWTWKEHELLEGYPRIYDAYGMSIRGLLDHETAREIVERVNAADQCYSLKFMYDVRRALGMNEYCGLSDLPRICDEAAPFTAHDLAARAHKALSSIDTLVPDIAKGEDGR